MAKTVIEEKKATYKKYLKNKIVERFIKNKVK
jgi:hypothetical protein